MNSCFFTPQSIVDLDEIYDFIATDNSTAALRFIKLLEKKCQWLAKSPAIGRKRRELSLELRSFPIEKYIIFYRPVQNGIQVIRILHGARDVEDIFEL